MIKYTFKKYSYNHPTALSFHKAQDTLNVILHAIEQKEKGAYLRFGDGDINLAKGKSDLLQTSNKKLRKEMRETLALNGKYIYKALPLHCKEYGLEDGMFPGNHECDIQWADNIIKKALPFWGGEMKDVYSPVALHFLASHKPSKAINFLKTLKSERPICIIGNEDIPKKVITDVFGSQCTHIKTAKKNSYFEIDKYEKEFDNLVLQKNDYLLVVIAMGCSGRVMQKRLLNKYENIFLFDFGSLLDALSGWNTRAWIELSGFKKDSFFKKLKK